MSDREVCDIFCTDEEKVNRLRKEVEKTRGLSPIFKALSDDTRIKIIYSLSKEELCVCDIAGIIGSSVAAASHHLRLLKNLGLAKHRRQGKMVFYSLKDHCIQEIINISLQHYKEHNKN